MQKFNKFSLAVFQKESVPGFPTKKTERQTQSYSDGPYSDTRLPDTRLKSGQGYRTYTVWMISGVALAACSGGGGGGGAPAPVATSSEHHTPGIEGAQAYYEDAEGNLRIIDRAVTDENGQVLIPDAVANEFEIYFDLTSATTADGTPAPAVTIRAGDVDNEVASYATTVLANAADAVEAVAPVPEPAEPGGAAADPESLNGESLLDDLIRELFDNVEAGEDAPKSANAGALQAGASVDDFQLLSTYSTETGASDTSLDLQSLNQDLGEYLDIASKAEQSNQAYLASEESETLLHLYAKRHFVIQEEYDRTGEGAEPNMEEYLAKQIYGVIHNELDVIVKIEDAAKAGEVGDFIFTFEVADESHDLDISFTKNDENAGYGALTEDPESADIVRDADTASIIYTAPSGDVAAQRDTTISISDGFTSQELQLHATQTLATVVFGNPITLSEAENAYPDDNDTETNGIETGITFHSHGGTSRDYDISDDRFEVIRSDENPLLGQLVVKEGAEFDYETDGDTITLQIDVIASDEAGSQTITTTVQFDLQDVNDAPEATGINSFNVLSGGTVDIASAFDDEDADDDRADLIFSATALPEGVTLEGATLTVAATVEEGSFDIQLSASDGALSSDPATLTITVVNTPADLGFAQESAPFTVKLELTSPYDILDAREVFAVDPVSVGKQQGSSIPTNQLLIDTQDEGNPYVQPGNYAVIIDYDHKNPTPIQNDSSSILDKNGNEVTLITSDTNIDVWKIDNSDYDGESGSLILGKGGDDEIILKPAEAGEDTIIYQIDSVGTENLPTALDGDDTVQNFYLGVERIFFLDTDAGNTDSDPTTLADLIAPVNGLEGISMGFVLNGTSIHRISISFPAGTGDTATILFYPENTLTVAEIEAIFDGEDGLNLDTDDDDGTIPFNPVLDKNTKSFTAENLEELFGAGNIEVISMDQLHEGDDDLQLYAVPADIL